MRITTKKMAAIVMAALAAAAVAQDGQRLAGASVADHSGFTNLPNFIRLNPSQQMRQEGFVNWATYALNVPQNSTFKAYDTFTDELGFTHTRHKQYMNGYPVEASQVISHMKDGKVVMLNGDYYQNFSSVSAASIDEASALKIVLKKVNAQKYMWENDNFEREMGFDFTPKGELVYVHKKGTDYSAENMRLAYKFNIFAEVPLYRANVFVDASTGEIIDEQNLICTANAVGTAVTKYSGTVTMTSDNYGTNQYRLRETGRGNGIQTYNLNHGTSTGSAVDFTSTSANWNVTGADQAASDAHWGAEMTYDYYKLVHNRNSIDNAGYALKSYVHYSNNYVNAFWNGSYMSYGDGDGSTYDIMTALDICGHEITHGLVSNTAQLGGSGSGEPGALNEGFADIFGTSIEAYARPGNHDWIMAKDIGIGGSQIRDLTNQHNSGEGAGPNCYQESGFWDAAQQEVHINSGPAGHWYYLLCVGGSGTSGCSNVYNVAGITMAKAEKIAFRGLTVYFTSNTNYANARTYTIQGATDLYGACSGEVASTTNAWYAVNVGTAYTGGFPTAGFSAANTLSCTSPLTVNFTNNSTQATSYSWNFGDGATSTSTSPAHTYTAGGVYNVQLIATGTCNATSKDTLVQNALVVVNGAPAAASPAVPACGPQSYSLTASGVGTLTWYDANGQVGTGSTYVTPTLTQTTTYSVTSSIMVAGTATLAGAPTNSTTLGAGGYLAISNNHYLTFDVTTAFTLKTVDIFAQSTSSSVAVSLEDNAGNVLYSLSPTISATGKNTLSLNWHIPVGTGYKIKATGANSLYRNSAGANYPIAVGTVASITGNDVMSTAGNYFYWFYNWVYATDVLCPSSATAVVATIQNCTGIANHANGGTIEIYPNPAHGNLFISAPQGIKNISVVDMIGKTVLTHAPDHATDVSLDVSMLPAGVYFVKVCAGDSNRLIKIVKQ